MNPELSVVVTVYNEEERLEMSLWSVLDQVFDDFELIIVDDGSTDNTPSILKMFTLRDKRVRVITFDKNRGRAAAANAGISDALAPVIARHDADDISMPDRFDLQLKALRSIPQIGAVGASLILDDGSIKRNPAYVTRNIFKKMLINHPTLMFRKRYFDLVGGYDVTLQRCSDWDFCCRLFKVGCTIMNLPKALVHYHTPDNDPAYYRDVHIVMKRWGDN